TALAMRSGFADCGTTRLTIPLARAASSSGRSSYVASRMRRCWGYFCAHSRTSSSPLPSGRRSGEPSASTCRSARIRSEPAGPQAGMALRLRDDIDRPRTFREHVHLVGEAGYFFFPGVTAAQGTPAHLFVDFTAGEKAVLLRGQVWARPSGGGLWLELPGA